MQKPSYDILILGAGVAGCAISLSLKLLDKNLKIVIVDRRSEGSHSQNEEVRIGETLPPHIATRLRELNLWKDFQKSNFQRSYGTSASWGSEDVYHNEFISSPYGYGWHIDRNRFDQLLIDQCRKSGIEIMLDSSLTDIIREGNEHWSIGLSGNGKVSSKFIVDATGKKAYLASRFGAKKMKSDRLIGIARAYDSKENEFAGSGAMVESVPDGWWYSSILQDNSSIVCFMTDSDVSREKSLDHVENFERQLQHTKYTKHRVGNSRSDLKIKAAHSQLLDKVVGDGWLAVGDSASSYDPLSALGVFKAMKLSKYASFAIMDYIKNNKEGLYRYEKIVKADFTSFLAKKDDYYQEENRFSDCMFWKRRRKSDSSTDAAIFNSNYALKHE